MQCFERDLVYDEIKINTTFQTLIYSHDFFNIYSHLYMPHAPQSN